MISSSLLGPLCAFGSSVTWAIGSVQYSRVSKDYSAFTINFSRALMALPLFVLSAFLFSGGVAGTVESYQAIRVSHLGWFTLGMLGSYGLGDSLFLWSSQSLGVPGALAIASCFPLWTVLAGYFFAGEAITPTQILGLCITLSGLILVILNIPKVRSPHEVSRFSLLGVFLAFATSIAWATNNYAVSRAGIDLTPWAGNTVRMILALCCCGLFRALFAKDSPTLLPRSKLSSLWWVFAIEAFGGSCFYFYGMSHSSLALGSTLSSLSPVLAVPVALILKLEKFSLTRTLGVALVVLGLWLLVT